MPQINIYKIEDEKEQDFLQILLGKWDRKNTITKTRVFNNENIEIGLTLYMITPEEDKPIAWNWVLEAFEEAVVTSIPNPKAIVLVDSRDAMYAVTFGSSYFVVDKYSDKNFSFDFARRLNYSEIKTTTLTTPNSYRNKVVNTYVQYTNFDFDSGESFNKIKAKVHLDEDFALYKEDIEIGNSIRFNIKTDSLENIADIIVHIEDTIEHKEVKVDFPVFQKLVDKEEIQELDNVLHEAILTGEYSIHFTEIDIIGSTEVFNHNDTTYKLMFKGKEKNISQLSRESLQEFALENRWELNEIILGIKVKLFKNDEPVCTNSIKDLIDFTVSERKSILSKGVWYRYNDDYLRYLSLSLNEIDVKYIPEYNLYQTEHHNFIVQRYALEKNNEEYQGKSQTEVMKLLKAKYYSERYYNIMMSESRGFMLYDRENVSIGTADVELMDLYKDNCMYAVKIGKSSEKLCYVVDQSIQSIKVYKHNLSTNKPQIDSVALIIVLERATQLPIINGKPRINELKMLTLKNKLDYWKKEVRLLGYKPIVYINYKFD